MWSVHSQERLVKTTESKYDAEKTCSTSNIEYEMTHLYNYQKRIRSTVSLLHSVSKLFFSSLRHLATDQVKTTTHIRVSNWVYYINSS